MRLPPRISRWVKWLEDPKNKQCQRTLFRGQKRCCLGGACNVFMEDNGGKLRKFRGDSDFLFADGTDELTEELPKTIAKWFGINTIPKLRVPPSLLLKAEGNKSKWATNLNDTYDFTFAEIAQCIRYTYKMKKAK